MSTESETTEVIPDWLPHGVLVAICKDAGTVDPGRAAAYAEVDADRVRRAIEAGDAILAAHRRTSDDDAIDVALARSSLLVMGALVRSLRGDFDGD